jgi:hypothetical protein
MAAGLVLWPGSASSQELPSPSPTPNPESPLIIGDTLVFLLGAVAIAGVLLLGLMVWRLGGGTVPADMRSLVEGMVLVMVTVAVIILDAAGKVTQEGLAPVLAATVGYAGGRITGAAVARRDQSTSGSGS